MVSEVFFKAKEKEWEKNYTKPLYKRKKGMAESSMSGVQKYKQRRNFDFP